MSKKNKVICDLFNSFYIHYNKEEDLFIDNEFWTNKAIDINKAKKFTFPKKPEEFKPLDFTKKDEFTLTRGQIKAIIDTLGNCTVSRNGRNNDDVLCLISNLEALIDE